MKIKNCDAHNINIKLCILQTLIFLFHLFKIFAALKDISVVKWTVIYAD